MATLAEFTIPAESFPLGSVFTDHPGVTVELERVIPTNKAIIPYFWIRGVGETEETEIEAAFRKLPDVKRVVKVDQVGGDYLKRIEWSADYQGVMKAIVETGATLISGVGTAEEWTFEIRADTRDGIAEFQRYCHEHDIPVTLTALHALSSIETGTEYNLTEAQREALILAYQRGYYQVPREASLDEMAKELDITGQSLGTRLQRGIHRLIGSTLISSA